jgi:hypothetical protein
MIVMSFAYLGCFVTDFIVLNEITCFYTLQAGKFKGRENAFGY